MKFEIMRETVFMFFSTLIIIGKTYFEKKSLYKSFLKSKKTYTKTNNAKINRSYVTVLTGMRIVPSDNIFFK